MKFISIIKNKLTKSSLSNEKGQGATEYILLLVVIVGLVMMFGPKIKTAVEKKVGNLEEGMEQIKSN